MSNGTPKLPDSNAVSELRDLYNMRKEARFKKHKDFAEILKKKLQRRRLQSQLIVRMLRSSYARDGVKFD